MKLGYKMKKTTEEDGFVRLTAESDILALKHTLKLKRSRYMIFEVKLEANLTKCVDMYTI